MATTGAVMAEDSSSSDDEALKRCQEAVWNCQVLKTKDDTNKKPSKRLVVADHEHDGNELQVTPGFQTHVATRLGAMLDCLISEKQSFVQPSVNTNSPEDEGFRLFSTSVPGVEPVEPPPPKRRFPSSSDSDSEMESRFKEAAVSISDILPSSASALSATPAVPETTSSETQEKVKKKKKKRNKLNPEENGHVHDNQILNQEEKVVKDDKKKKKKKVTPGDSAQIVDKPEEPTTSTIHISSNSEVSLPNNPAETRTKVKKKKKGQQDSHQTTAKDNKHNINQDEDQTAKQKKKKPSDFS